MVSFRYTAGTILIVPIIMKNYASVEWQLWKNFFHCNYFELVVTLTGNCGTLRYVSVLSFISNRARLLSYWLKCWFIFQTFYLKGINIWMTIFQNDARRKKMCLVMTGPKVYFRKLCPMVWVAEFWSWILDENQGLIFSLGLYDSFRRGKKRK